MSNPLLALFPLNTVLFPNMLLPLHIFEERYKLMINTCLAQEKPFGVVLIYSGTEVGGQAVPHSVGTVAQIVNWERLSDGRVNILTVGARRFRITEYVKSDLPYLLGSIETWDDEPVDAPYLAELVTEVRHNFTDYLTLLMSLADRVMTASQFELPSDPTVLSYHIATNLQVDISEKQDLLEEPSAVARLEHELTLLRREGDFLQRLISLQGRTSDDDLSGTSMLYVN
jgi:Lon protease-like protein